MQYSGLTRIDGVMYQQEIERRMSMCQLATDRNRVFDRMNDVGQHIDIYVC